MPTLRPWSRICMGAARQWASCSTKSWMTQAMKMDMQMQMLELGQRILLQLKVESPRIVTGKRLKS
jgi:hypothetical protein